MNEIVNQEISGADIFIACAAVADFSVETSEHKIKKSSDTLTLELTQNADILAAVATSTNKPYCVGFAAETKNIIDYAKEKITIQVV